MMIIRILLVSQVALLFLCSAAYSFENTINYHIQYSDKNLGLEIRLKTYLDQNGVYKILFPRGTTTYTIKGASDKTQIINTDNTYIKEVKGQPGEQLEIDYTYYLPNSTKSIAWPIIEKDYLFFKFEKVFATPEHQPESNWKIKIDTSMLPKNFVIHSSHSDNIRNISFESTIVNFKDWVLVCGELNEKKIIINKKTIRLITLNQLKSLSKEPVFYLEKLIKAQRDFWNDNRFENYLIILDERESNDIPPGPSGMHFENSIILQLINFGPSKNYMNIHALSHELFHAWIGKKILFGRPQGSLQWFLEGFNDYFGLQIAFENNLIKREEYIEEINYLIQSYYLSPIKHVSNDVIAKNFYTDPFYNKLAEVRGHFYAKLLASKWKKSKLLSRIVHEIYYNFQKNGNQYIQQKDIDQIFYQYLSKDQWNDYVNYIYKGDPIQFYEKDFGNFKLSYQAIDVPDLGFHILDLIEKRVISQVNSNSPAYVAGLRNGQKVKSHTINLLNTTRPMSIWIEEDNKIKEISFLPNKKTEIVPQFS